LFEINISSSTEMDLHVFCFMGSGSCTVWVAVAPICCLK
jgi:hypothetical protein